MYIYKNKIKKTFIKYSQKEDFFKGSSHRLLKINISSFIIFILGQCGCEFVWSPLPRIDAWKTVEQSCGSCAAYLPRSAWCKQSYLLHSKGRHYLFGLMLSWSEGVTTHLKCWRNSTSEILSTCASISTRILKLIRVDSCSVVFSIQLRPQSFNSPVAGIFSSPGWKHQAATSGLRLAEIDAGNSLRCCCRYPQAEAGAVGLQPPQPRCGVLPGTVYFLFFVPWHVTRWIMWVVRRLAIYHGMIHQPNFYNMANIVSPHIGLFNRADLYIKGTVQRDFHSGFFTFMDRPRPK